MRRTLPAAGGGGGEEEGGGTAVCTKGVDIRRVTGGACWGHNARAGGGGRWPGLLQRPPNTLRPPTDCRQGNKEEIRVAEGGRADGEGRGAVPPLDRLTLARGGGGGGAGSSSPFFAYDSSTRRGNHSRTSRQEGRGGGSSTEEEVEGEVRASPGARRARRCLYEVEGGGGGWCWWWRCCSSGQATSLGFSIAYPTPS